MMKQAKVTIFNGTEISTINGTKIITLEAIDDLILKLYHDELYAHSHLSKDHLATEFYLYRPIKIKGITDWLPFRNYMRSDFKTIVVDAYSVDHLQEFKVQVEE